MTYINPDALVRNMDSYFINKNDRIARLGMTIDTFQNIPGLVGFWPMSSVQRSTGDAYDLSGQGRTLTYNGNPTYNYFNDIVPYIAFDGTGDFLSRADETDLDITGTETIYNSSVQGMTIGGWFWFDEVSLAKASFSKWNTTGNQRAYILNRNTSAQFAFAVSSNGTDFPSSGPGNAIIISTWNFAVGTFIPSTSLKITVNGNITENTVGIPAAIFNSSADLNIGARNNGSSQFMDGRTSLCFLSANSLSDAYINALFQQSRVLFGV